MECLKLLSWVHLALIVLTSHLAMLECSQGSEECPKLWLSQLSPLRSVLNSTPSLQAALNLVLRDLELSRHTGVLALIGDLGDLSILVVSIYYLCILPFAVLKYFAGLLKKWGKALFFMGLGFLVFLNIENKQTHKEFWSNQALMLWSYCREGLDRVPEVFEKLVN